ncbi:hypothetical protein K470DRAFT_271666 [Piedraia hortae CBS 480.64]|uniref:Uncharacterized protein n=1 Tax=Piedraia hortae CBS 480.64 TaxID=1314780 RepID=A0A6A7BXB2_9PEZI|nr:hypothetical protein K470DRAFT_271666 [Piedraia hortae CBS 480.64]
MAHKVREMLHLSDGTYALGTSKPASTDEENVGRPELNLEAYGTERLKQELHWITERMEKPILLHAGVFMEIYKDTYEKALGVSDEEHSPAKRIALAVVPTMDRAQESISVVFIPFPAGLMGRKRAIRTMLREVGRAEHPGVELGLDENAKLEWDQLNEHLQACNWANNPVRGYAGFMLGMIKQRFSEFKD